MNTKLIAVTMGDPGGIGPEIALKTLKKSRKGRFLLIGSGQALLLLKKKLGLSLAMDEIDSRAAFRKSKARILFLDIDAYAPGDVVVGRLNKYNGAKALAAVAVAAELARLGDVSAIVTAPVNKSAVRLSSPGFIGHTEFLAKAAKVKKYAMMFVGSRFLVALATIHTPLKKVSGAITSKVILEKIALIADFLKKYGFSKKEIAVCALNPHGRETGDEEDRVILPAIHAAQRRKMNVSGPHPGDSVFYHAYHGKFGAVLAMYHDQALAPFKMISFRDGVNVTLGLPYLRTSPDHGTAFDIAYQGKADTGSFESAFNLAVKLLGVSK